VRIEKYLNVLGYAYVALIIIMRNNFKILILAGIWILVIAGCSVQWTEAIRDRNIAHKEFKESVDIGINKKLIIVPISIH